MADGREAAIRAMRADKQNPDQEDKIEKISPKIDRIAANDGLPTREDPFNPLGNTIIRTKSTTHNLGDRLSFVEIEFYPHPIRPEDRNYVGVHDALARAESDGLELHTAFQLFGEVDGASIAVTIDGKLTDEDFRPTIKALIIDENSDLGFRDATAEEIRRAFSFEEN